MSNAVKLDFTIVIPCFNEEDAIETTLNELTDQISTDKSYEIIVVNDGSSDDTAAVLLRASGKLRVVRVIEHKTNLGYGAALKSGIRAAKSELIAITDADGTYPNDRIGELVDLCADYDMVVGARTGSNVSYSKIRAIPKFFLKWWVSWVASQKVPDINSGMRVFRKSVAEKFFGILSNKFSFTITITLAMLTTYRPTLFVPIDYYPRIGSSKIRPVRDTLRFMSIILRTGTYFAPIRAFAPIFIGLLLAAIGSGVYDIFVLKNLTDTTVLLFLFSLNVGMFALLADMIDKRIN